MGYRSMCRFFALRFPLVMGAIGYEWAVRIDDDSHFPEPIRYNLVVEMLAANAIFGASMNLMCRSHPSVKVYLWF
jgi:hypothetical protein